MADLDKKAIKEVISYLFWGVMTTVVNIVVFYLTYDVMHCVLLLSNILAWFLSVLFAYVTNRKFVFHSEASGVQAIAKECVSFFSGRLGTGALDMGLMYLTVELLAFNAFAMKIVVNVVVIVLNYVISKLLIFKKKEK